MRLSFQAVRRAVEADVISPRSRDAIECLARFVPKGTGPSSELFGSALFVEKDIWRFRSDADAKRFAFLMESYFRNFDASYRIRSLGTSEVEAMLVQAR